MAEQSALLNGSFGLSLSLDELKEQHALALETAGELQKKLDEAESDAAKQQAEAQALLERLLAEQRQRFEDDLTKAGKSLQDHASEMTDMRNKIAEGRKEVEQKAKEARSNEAELQRTIKQLTSELEKLKAAAEAKKKAKEKKPGILGGMDLDEGPDAPPVSVQIGEALRKNATRVLDLFRSWDTDGASVAPRRTAPAPRQHCCCSRCSICAAPPAAYTPCNR